MCKHQGTLEPKLSPKTEEYLCGFFSFIFFSFILFYSIKIRTLNNLGLGKKNALECCHWLSPRRKKILFLVCSPSTDPRQSFRPYTNPASSSQTPDRAVDPRPALQTFHRPQTVLQNLASTMGGRVAYLIRDQLAEWRYF